jgi:hypothetical protein
MKTFKLLGLAAMAAMALTALVGASSASATALYNGATKLGVGSEFDYSSKTGVKVKVTDTSGAGVIDECDSTIKGTTTNAGGAGIEVQRSNSAYNWTNCTVPTVTDVRGGLKIADLGGTEGTVRSNAEIGVTFNTIFYGVCRYGFASGVHLGKEQTSASGTATLSINAVAAKQPGSEMFCPSSTIWTGTYVSTTPDNERIEAS